MKVNKDSVIEIALGVLIALAIMRLAEFGISKIAEKKDSYDDDIYYDEEEEID